MIRPALIALALITTPTAAQQQPFMTADATSIVVGQSVTYSLVIPDPLIFIENNPPAYTPDGGLITYEPWGFALLQFFSGNGQQMQPTWFPETSEYGATFTYLEPGTFIAFAVGALLVKPFVCYPTYCNEFGPATGPMFSAMSPSVTVSVPEPSTWALLLFGFAFFAIKGIWPRSSHE